MSLPLQERALWRPSRFGLAACGVPRLVDDCKHFGTLHDKHLCPRPSYGIGAISKRVLRNPLQPSDRQLWPALVAPYSGSKVVIGSDAARAQSTQHSQVLSTSCSGRCQARSRRPADAELRWQLKKHSTSLND